MGQKFEQLTAAHCAFIKKQPMFFVATADREGRVNVSPKGLDAFRIMDETHIRWLNLTGSGNETAAHILAHPRMTIMFCAFEGDPLILRLYDTAQLINETHPEWDAAWVDFPDVAGQRQVYDMRIDLVLASCGMGVPEMQFERPRGEAQLVPYFERLGTDKTKAYQALKNSQSLDGAPTDVLPR